MMGAISALLSFIIIALNALGVSAAQAQAMAVNFHERKSPEQLTEEMTCPNGFPRKSMDGCCRWTSPPTVCSAKNRAKSNITNVACMEEICSRGKGKGTWSLHKPDPSGPGVMNVCCNTRMASLQSRVKGTGLSEAKKTVVTRDSMDAFDPTAEDPTNSKDQAKNVALLLLFLTLGLFAMRQKVVEIPLPGYFQKKQKPATQEFGLSSGSKPPVCREEAPKRPLPVETPAVEQYPETGSNLDSAKEQLISFDDEPKQEFAPLCDL